MRSAERLLKIRGEYVQAAMSSAKRASSLTSMAPPGLTSAEWLDGRQGAGARVGGFLTHVEAVRSMNVTQG
jgi:hypothetical protein